MENLEHIINPLSTSGLAFIIVGLIMYKFPPKKINMLYGYRTKTSMLTQERWDFAQIYSAKKMAFTGLIMVLLSINYLFFDFSGPFIIVSGLVILVFSALYLYLKTENAIRATFKDH